jgi:hypothetical protein
MNRPIAQLEIIDGGDGRWAYKLHMGRYIATQMISNATEQDIVAAAAMKAHDYGFALEDEEIQQDEYPACC